MNARHLERRDDWSRRAQRFSPLVQRESLPMAMPRRFRSQRQAYMAGLRLGGLSGCAITVAVLVVGMWIVKAIGGAL